MNQRDAEDPFLIGREAIWQGCDWPNENFVSIPVKTWFNFEIFVLFHVSPLAERAALRAAVRRRRPSCAPMRRGAHASTSSAAKSNRATLYAAK
jgi:hypothetical protein